MDDQESGFRTWQKALIGLLVLLLMGALYLYFTGTTLRGLFGIGDGGGGEKVGHVERVTGALKRQPFDSLEFLDAPAKSDLFNEDTVMTGPEDRATLTLIDGSQIELEPGTMIRLSFESSFTLGGIQRRVLINVVSGNVKGQLKTGQIIRRGRPSPTPGVPTPTFSEVSPVPEPSPTPSPSPTVPAFSGAGLRFTSPRNQSTLRMADGNRPPLRAQLKMASTSEPDVSVLTVLRDAQGREVYRKPTEVRGGVAVANIQFDRPGVFTAEMVAPDGNPFPNRNAIRFTVLPTFRGIQARGALIGGQALTSNHLRGKRLKDFNITFRWEDPGLKVDRYRLVLTDANGSVVLDRVVEGTEFTLEKGRLQQDRMFYTVTATLPSGYVATTGRVPFTFNFLSPTQTLPKNGMSVSSSVMGKAKRGGVLFTWQKTSFTDSYDFELAADSAFARILKTVNLKENFVIFRNLKPGQYYWRVRALGASVKSPPNEPFRLIVTP